MIQNTTFAMIKPDAYENASEITNFIVQHRFHISHLEATGSMTQENARWLYGEHEHKPFFEELVEFTCSGPVVLLGIQAPFAVDTFRRLLGPTDWREADKSTIRGRFAKGPRIMENAMHGSADDVAAREELNHFFGA